MTAPLSTKIAAMIDEVINLFPEKFRTELMAYVNAHAETICQNFPQPYGQEIV